MVTVQKRDGARSRCEMTNVLQTCRNEKHGLLPDSFCNTVRTALSVLAKCLIGENHLLMGGRKIQNFRSYEKQLTNATTKTWNQNSKVTHSCEQWKEIELGKLSCLFRQISET